MADSLTGVTVLERYRCADVLGQGASSTVYAARDLLVGRDVALKHIRERIDGARESRDLYRREVHVAQAVDHPGLVEVFDSGDLDDGSFVIVMELLLGETLEDLLERAPPSRAQALDLVEALLIPLAALHANAIVHRDIKPSNVFMTEGGQIKLFDLGIAKDESDVSVTRTGTGMGTPQYMAPEQAVSARSVGTTADVWAIGVLLYRVLSGVLPFEGDNAYEVVLKACSDPHEPLGAVASEVDETLVQLVDVCLSKDASARPPDAQALLEALQGARNGQVTWAQTSPAGPLTRDSAPSDEAFAAIPPRPPAGRKTPALTMLLVVAAAALLGAFGYVRWQRTQATVVEARIGPAAAEIPTAPEIAAPVTNAPPASPTKDVLAPVDAPAAPAAKGSEDIAPKPAKRKSKRRVAARRIRKATSPKPEAQVAPEPKKEPQTVPDAGTRKPRPQDAGRVKMQPPPPPPKIVAQPESKNEPKTEAKKETKKRKKKPSPFLTF